MSQDMQTCSIGPGLHMTSKQHAIAAAAAAADDDDDDLLLPSVKAS
jgi:hypothetical protein